MIREGLTSLIFSWNIFSHHTAIKCQRVSMKYKEHYDFYEGSTVKKIKILRCLKPLSTMHLTCDCSYFTSTMPWTSEIGSLHIQETQTQIVFRKLLGLWKQVSGFPQSRKIQSLGWVTQKRFNSVQSWNLHRLASKEQEAGKL